MMNTGKILFMVLSFLALSAFTTETTTETFTSTITLQPFDERSAQEGLPIAKDALWDVLEKTEVKIDDEKGLYNAIFPDDVKKLNGQTIKISGFMMPLESEEKFSHFLLSRRTPTCFFCPPGSANEIIEIYSDKPTEWIEDLVTYEGKFGLIDNKEMEVFYKMTDAVKK